MPTIPLYNTDALPDAWHQVRAPGGYECWRCEADDVKNDRQIIAEFWHGDAFDAEYLREFNRYLRRPTRTNPPLPQQFIRARVIVIHQGRLEAKSEHTCPIEQFAGQTDRGEVRMGPSEFRRIDGEVRLSIATDVALTLALRARIQQPVSVFSGRQQWMLTAHLCEATGELRLDRTIPFSGRGCCDHLFGDRPLVNAGSRTLRGRIMTDDRCVAFSILENPREAIVVESTPNGAKRHLTRDFEIDWTRLTVSIPQWLMLHPPVQLQKTATISRQIHEAELLGKPAHVISELF